MSQHVEIGICHWDGFVSPNTKCSLIEGARESKKLGMKNIKIYCGNKVETTYSDLQNILYPTTTLRDILKHSSYTQLFNLGFEVVVIVMFSINKNRDDDYWRRSFPTHDESQFTEAFRYLSTFTNTTFIISNWESDHVYNAATNKEEISKSLINLINIRKKVCNVSNVKIALELNEVKAGECVLNNVLPYVNCDMVSYSCYTSQENPEVFSYAINKIRRKMKPNMSLFIGEFGFPVNRMRSDKVHFLYENLLQLFGEKRIKLAFYWNLYDNEKNSDGTFSGFGLITPYGKPNFMAYKIFNKRNVIYVRHGYSMANKWKNKNNTNHIDKNAAKQHNLYNPYLCDEGISDIIKTRDEFWNFIKSSSPDLPIKIFCSPLRRTLHTLLVCLQNNPMPNTSVYISPLLAEIGDSCENKDVLYDVRLEPILTDISRLVHDVHFIHGCKKRYSKVTKHGSKVEYAQEFSRYIQTEKTLNGCCLICFSHFETIKTITGQCLNNFGRDTCVASFTI